MTLNMLTSYSRDFADETKYFYDISLQKTPFKLAL